MTITTKKLKIKKKQFLKNTLKNYFILYSYRFLDFLNYFKIYLFCNNKIFFRKKNNKTFLFLIYSLFFIIINYNRFKNVNNKIYLNTKKKYKFKTTIH